MFQNKIELVAAAKLKPYPGNARTHSKRQIRQIADSISRFRFTNPVLVDDELMILAGHGRVEAAKLLGMEEVPIVRLSHLSDADKRAYVLADNQLALKAGWDQELLAVELQGLIDLNYDVGAIGFEVAEIDIILDAGREASPHTRSAPEDQSPEPPRAAVTQLGDLWVLGRHRLLCADARDGSAYDALLGDEEADVMFTDPPYNVPIDGFVGGSGKVKHESFAMGCGEMTEAEFETFLASTLGAASARLKDGAIAFVCMDWRHMKELLQAGAVAFDELKNLCVWTKSNGGMGSLYRSQHELVFVFKKGSAQHENNVELGRHGRNRTNVWSYAGANTFSKSRDADLAMHPTVKPVALIVDALKDVSARADVILDPFAGSGSTLIAAEQCGRTGRVIELDPKYCDVVIRRFEIFTGKPAILAASSESFEETAVSRRLRTAPEPSAVQGDGRAGQRN